MRQPFRKASVYIALLLIFQAITGLLIIIVTGLYQSILSSYLEDIERCLLISYLFHFYIFGVQLIVTFLCSLSMWNRLWRRRCTPNVRLMISIWLFYSCVIIASGFGSVWNLYHNIDVLEDSAANSLLSGIDEYYTTPKRKLLWDALQLRKECCGVYSYKDWMDADWMPKQTDASSQCRSRTVLAPIACSKRSAESSYLQDLSSKDRSAMPSLSVDSIYTNGCLAGFSAALWRYFYILLFLVLMALKFLIFICCFTKYVLQRQNTGDGCDNGGLIDEEGHPLVMVKYPRNVRCVIIGEDDLASDVAPDSFCNCEEAGAGETCDYCAG
ncbi:uncharacterized protein LOC6561833 [Drosophila grimshawi]|uniref:GH10369 n=1 Tax=Drosophila grimshawi TaxID=7222 RepID=B4JEG6_DROGR|nr:uncharacterized protein LOC6561833 [Drosophila grimshawi]EDW03686.1 GH10369 [Drosophila grimshawi]